MEGRIHFNGTNGLHRAALGSHGNGTDVGPAYISPTQIAIGAAVVLVNAGISFSLGLGLHWQLIIGSFRYGFTGQRGSGQCCSRESHSHYAFSKWSSCAADCGLHFALL